MTMRQGFSSFAFVKAHLWGRFALWFKGALRSGGALLLLSLAAACSNTGAEATRFESSVGAAEAANRGLLALPKNVLDNPDILLGKNESDLRQIFGKPSLVRREQPAEIWQFAAKSCVLDLYLYDKGQGLALAHIEERDRQGETLTTSDCLKQLARP